MRTFRKILAGLVIAFAMIIVPGMTIVGGAASAITNPDFYESDLFKETFYDLLISEITQEIIASNPEATIPEEELEFMIREAVSPEWLSQTAVELIHALEEDPNTDITISLKEVKEKWPLETTEIPDEIELSSSQAAPLKMFLLFALESGNMIQRGVIQMTVAYLVIIGLLVWKPLSTAVAWISTTLFLIALSLTTMLMAVKNFFVIMSAGNMEKFPKNEIGAVVDMALKEVNLYKYGFYLAGALTLGFYIYLKHRTPSHEIQPPPVPGNV